MADRHPVGPTAVPVTSVSVSGGGGGGGGLTDGDYGDIIVSGAGTAMDIDSGVLTAFGRSLTDDADAAAARATLGLGTLATQSGTFSGTSSGTNTGDQFTAMTSSRILGRITAGFGPAEELTAANVKTILSLVAGDISGLAAIATSGSAADLVAGTVPAARMPALTGDVTTSAGAVATTIANGAVSLVKMANVATGTVFYRKTAGSGAPEVQTLATLKTDLGLTGTNSGDQTITLTGDVTGSGTGSFAATIGANKVTYAQMQDVSATNRFLGRITAGAGDPEELTGTQATTLLDTFTSTLKGLVPGSGGGTTNFLRADGTWAAPPSGGGSGSITASGYTMTTARMLGRTTAATGAIEEMTAANVKSFLVMTAADVGALPITAGAGAWSGYTLFDSGSSGGLVAHNTTNAVYASISTDNAATGYFYGQNNGATTWIQFGGGMTANTRQPITGSHAFEFSTTPYVGANAIFHAGNYPTPRVQSVTSSATVTPTFSDDLVKITAQAAALNLANPTGTAIPAKPIKIRIKDNGTARAITYGTQYRAIGVTLPTTTVANKTLYLGLIYNADDTKWDVVAVAQEA